MLASAMNFAIGFFGYPFEGQYQQSITIEADGVSIGSTLTALAMIWPNCMKFNNTLAPYKTYVIHRCLLAWQLTPLLWFVVVPMPKTRPRAIVVTGTLHVGQKDTWRVPRSVYRNSWTGLISQLKMYSSCNNFVPTRYCHFRFLLMQYLMFSIYADRRSRLLKVLRTLYGGWMGRLQLRVCLQPFFSNSCSDVALSSLDLTFW